MTLCIAEGNHPSIVLQKEIENGCLELWFGGPGTHIAQIGSRCRQENWKDLILGRDPSEGL
jgi:hypothetical protein